MNGKNFKRDTVTVIMISTPDLDDPCASTGVAPSIARVGPLSAEVRRVVVRPATEPAPEPFDNPEAAALPALDDANAPQDARQGGHSPASTCDENFAAQGLHMPWLAFRLLGSRGLKPGHQAQITTTRGGWLSVRRARRVDCVVKGGTSRSRVGIIESLFSPDGEAPSLESGSPLNRPTSGDGLGVGRC
jgi:hypothetical protein